ncbi:MAG: hypothetical protein HOO96_27145 [Polyangiaceae bacterium]|nr:hypothetical protein [Polyangiaceae bacterium]
MSTRAVIAYATKDGGFKGVWNHWDGNPAALGNSLLEAVRSHRGSLDRVVNEAICDAPHGWSSYATRQRAEQDDDDVWPRFFGLEHVPDFLDFNYLYLFDVAARRLQVIEATESKIAARSAIATVTFATDGTPTPSRLEDPPPPWQQVSVVALDDGWTSSTRARAARVREAFDAQTDDPAQLQRVLRAAFEHAVVAAWPDWSEARNPLTAAWGWGEEPRAHEIQLGRVRLRYGCPSEWRFDDEFPLIDAQGNYAKLDLTPSAWAQHLEATGVEDAKTLADLLLAVLGAASLDREGEFQADDGQLYQYFRVVDGVDSETEMALARARKIDPDCDVGDDLGLPVRVNDWPWALVDWMAESAS